MAMRVRHISLTHLIKNTVFCVSINRIFTTVMGMNSDKMAMIKPEDALEGRTKAIETSSTHAVTNNRMSPPFPENLEMAMFGLGCFWGAERKFWQQKGVYSTQVGYSGGYTINPTYKEVCTGKTGHCEVVRVVFDPVEITYTHLIKVFWENHDPTQGMRQGKDTGTQYRSGIYYYNEEQAVEATRSKELYEKELQQSGYKKITTEVKPASEFYYAEDYHQQYLHKNPGGYCSMQGTGVSCPIGLGKKN